MNKELILQTQSQFDALTQTHPDAFDLEFWFARDLQEPLGYARWENFLTAIKRAIESCKTTGYEVGHHFRGVTKLITHGKGGQREIEDFMLTRYGCYLIAQNGDPRKEPIAFAQSYFAVQTRKLELIEERLSLLHRLEVLEKLRASEKALSDNIFERGVDDDGFGRIRSKGDAALFGGHATQAMKDKFGITQSRPLADFLPTLTIAAKNLATEMTNHNVQHADLRGEPAITDEHVQNNTSVRQMLVTRYQLPATAAPPQSIIQNLTFKILFILQILSSCLKFTQNPKFSFPCPAEAAKRVGGPPNALRSPRNALTKASPNVTNIYHESPRLPHPDSREEQDRRKEPAYFRLYGEFAVD